MRFITRWAFRLIVLGVVLAVALVLTKDIVLREAVESALRGITGLECHVRRLEVRLLSPTVRVVGLRCYHPSYLGGGCLIDVRDVHLEYHPSAMLRRQLHLVLLRIDVAEITLVDGKQGQSSLELLRQIWSEATKRGEVPWFEFSGVDTLNLSIDRVRRLRLGTSVHPPPVELRLHDQVLRDIRTTADFEVALGRVLTPALAKLATSQ